MSLCSQLIKLPRKVRARRFDPQQSQLIMSQKCRADFENYFTALMKSSNADQPKSAMNPSDANFYAEQMKNDTDETLWQNEFKGTNYSKSSRQHSPWVNFGLPMRSRSFMVGTSSLDIGSITGTAGPVLVQRAPENPTCFKSHYRVQI